MRSKTMELHQSDAHLPSDPPQRFYSDDRGAVCSDWPRSLQDLAGVDLRVSLAQEFTGVYAMLMSSEIKPQAECLIYEINRAPLSNQSARRLASLRG
jgi:hypothetical protein